MIHDSKENLIFYPKCNGWSLHLYFHVQSNNIVVDFRLLFGFPI